MGRQLIRTAVLATAFLFAGMPVSGQDDLPLDARIQGYLAERGAEVQLAPEHQLVRRYAIDFTGVIPSLADLDACHGMTPPEMFEYFRTKPAMDHTGGERPYIWSNLLKDSDHFLFSNSRQFSQVGHIREFSDRLRGLYDTGGSYKEFTRWALTSQMFLNRFPSGADRANASFFLFLGRDSLASEVPVGNMWNGYVLRNPDIDEGDAENNADYHVYEYDPTICADGRVLCRVEFWGQWGERPEDAINTMVESHLFVEATVARYWERYIGVAFPAVDFPDLHRALVIGFRNSDYDINWLIREIVTSAAYTQEMLFR